MRAPDPKPSGLTPQVLRWVLEVVGGATVSRVRSLHGLESPWWVDLESTGGAPMAVVVRTPSSRIDAAMIRTNVAALGMAKAYGLPAPRLIAADPDGTTAGVSASVETVLPGTSRWPDRPSVDLLEASGATIARLHRIDLDASPDLPLRPRPIAVDDFASERRSGRMATTDLLRRADERLLTIPAPVDAPVFVHGDVWPGNTVLTGATDLALIDWKTAGVGSPGVDLGELRKQVAIRYGEEAPAHVQRGWERAMGTSARDLPYWDATAALNTPTASDGPTAAARRDAFLAAALARL